MVFKSANCDWPLYLATYQKYSKKNINERLNQLFKQQFDSLITPLFSNDYLLNNQSLDLNLDQSSIISQEQFDVKSYLKNIFLEINTIINLKQKRWRKYFKFIIGYAVYLGLYAVVIELPYQHKAEFIRYMNKYDDRLLFNQLHIILKVEYSGEKLERWDDYIEIRKGLNKSLKLDLMLKVEQNLPSQKYLNRWIAERIDYIVINPNQFTQNSKKFPVLSGKLQIMVRKLFKHKTKIIIQQKQNQSLQQYVKFIQFMFDKQNKLTQKQSTVINVADVLQIPLQPYYDNLQAETYQVFENDNAKYDEYEIALTSAFLSFPPEKKITIFYIGSGRGALIYRCFSASKKTQRNIYIYAIQKNPYPLQSLKKRIKSNKWEKNIEIVFSDIKDWKPKNSADIFLSQLLGGFGDNQLSPECLYWAQIHLQKNTICIPQRYSSFITPISYSSVYRTLKQENKQNYFVVYLHNYYAPTKVQKCWTFEHPIKNQQQFNKVSSNIFSFNEQNIIHGFAGYFDCDLYQNSRYSIHPDSHTPDMYSWFPIFFSFKEPVHVKPSSKLQINIWRCTNKQKVWYEWQYELIQDKKVQYRSIIHNLNGKTHSIYK